MLCFEESRYLTMKRRQVNPAPSSCGSGIASSSLDATLTTIGSSSSTIPLPRSHIHRTPSEIQLADEVRRAEHDDVRMYARLVVGMQSQIQRDYYTNGGVIHPLSKKSLQGVVKTKHANDEDLKKLDGENEDDWETSFIPEEQHEDSCSVMSPWSTLTQRPPPKSESDASLSTHGSMKNQEEEEDECVFSLEL
mmetsp:Transcript_6241/g.13599  ORF Transcript_6241/g.13599 Transcript_6241/m.13599 type:complete len:193 (-) Transcript_6241:321-899(-)